MQNRSGRRLESRFIGKNFVFDDRLGERITEDVIAHCHQCGKPCDTHTNCKNDGCHLLFIQCEACAEKICGLLQRGMQGYTRYAVGTEKEIRKGVNKGKIFSIKAGCV